MKADGIEYDERMTLLEEISWPQPLAELLGATYEIYRETHPWLPEDGLGPKSIVREMYSQGMSFTDFVGRYQLGRSERSEEHTSELQSLMRISYAVFCLKKKNITRNITRTLTRN